MVDITHKNWPTFSMVQIHGSGAEDPDWEGPDLMIEAPAEMVGYRYEAADALTKVSGTGHGGFVRFGSNGVFGSTLLNTVTGEVVQHVPGADQLRLMNSSLPAFTEIVRAFFERFPFYGSDSDESEFKTAAADVERIVREIDPSAFIQDGFWATLVDDINMGDFSTEEIIETE
ncbi:SUKH-4 family immunity protein [Streptomyces sp. NPDC057654]|uniref:SUKH-4 family immunity protein n=1 Tax=Streptomyces sp. NPDC057654 TaxID=3346196 RepID=UPI00368A3692